MAITNHERVGRALEIFKDGMAPFVDRELMDGMKSGAVRQDDIQGYLESPILKNKPVAEWDASALLKVMWDTWNAVFKKTLGFAERSLVSEMREHRNNWAHQGTFSSDDVYRVLDSAGRLLTAVSAAEQAAEIDKMKQELLRLKFDEQVRSANRKKADLSLEFAGAAPFKPWREVVQPHRDVASGQYQQAEFAADLWQVHVGSGSAEYRDPVEFFRRTYLTESLKRLLSSAVERLANNGGDPVVQLQTNFGGGKTHSMLALYHLASGIGHTELAGIDEIMRNAGVAALPRANRAVVVGNKISPGNPTVKDDGTEVRTIWGEIAWQLGGRAAFDRIAEDDRQATNPGDRLREIFNDYSPCLILIDEWVAYARQLHDDGNLPGGSFETQFTFAQALTEAAKDSKNCLLVVSLPASDTAGSPHTQADDVEVGGIRGREALDRLRNVIGRVESSWRPATAEEGFEIVRRRLFEPLSSDSFRERDLTARAFSDLYKQQSQEFPLECREADYETRIKAAYPIHPEVFDRLYNDWSTLVKFQRTRGVLRLMAAVIHSLWESGDRNPLIMPSLIPIDDRRVQFELTRYLSDNWAPIIEKDVDGGSSLPMKIDAENTNLGKHHSTRRVARTIYLGSAPTTAAAHMGIEDRRIKLGCAMPGEPTATFGDALRRLAEKATFLYQDGNRYWYSTQPTVAKLARERAEELKRDHDKVVIELENRLKNNLAQRGEFKKIHIVPQNSHDVPDEMETRLVVLSSEHTYSKDPGNRAEKAAMSILEMRGNSPRIYRNSLVFLAADSTRLQDLDEALRSFIAWRSILEEKENLDLGAHQTRQAEEQRKAADAAINARIPETFQWLLVPTQESPQSPLTTKATRLTGNDALALRAAKKLRSDESMIIAFGPPALRMELDKVLWRGNHVAVKQLADDFARYCYLPRLSEPSVLVRAVEEGVALLSWQQDSFALADSFDEKEKRYRGLVAGRTVSIDGPESTRLLVKSEVAAQQMKTDAEAAAAAVTHKATSDAVATGETELPDSLSQGVEVTRPESSAPQRPKRFYAIKMLDPARVMRDAGTISEEIIVHLHAIVDSSVTVKIEIIAETPDGFSETVVRTVTENCNALKFDAQGFESE